jgi:ribosomal protein S18 acetylase RimI-like enzyme
VGDLIVLPACRGQGYGQALLNQAEAYAAGLGATTLRLRVKGRNHLARSFYSRAGYAEYEIEVEKRLGR